LGLKDDNPAGIDNNSVGEIGGKKDNTI